MMRGISQKIEAFTRSVLVLDVVRCFSGRKQDPIQARKSNVMV